MAGTNPGRLRKFETDAERQRAHREKRAAERQRCEELKDFQSRLQMAINTAVYSERLPGWVRKDGKADPERLLMWLNGWNESEVEKGERDAR